MNGWEAMFMLSGAARTISEFIDKGYRVTGCVMSRPGSGEYVIISDMNSLHVGHDIDSVIAKGKGESQWTCQFDDKPIEKDDGK